jgi:hypothetical protein
MQDEFEKRWAACYPARSKYSPISGFFHTEFGMLNQVISIWPYADLNERMRLREEANKDDNWPPPVSDLIVHQQVEFLVPWEFVPEWPADVKGPYFELRQYTFRPGSLPKIQENWKAALPSRTQFSKPCLIGHIESGPTANSFIHLWAYPSMQARDEARVGAGKTGMWPPAGGKEYYLSQQNKLLMPASYSPAQ